MSGLGPYREAARILDPGGLVAGGRVGADHLLRYRECHQATENLEQVPAAFSKARSLPMPVVQPTKFELVNGQGSWLERPRSALGSR